MGSETIVIYIVAAGLLVASLIKDKKKTAAGIKKGAKSFIKLMPVLIPLFLIIGILLAVVTPEFITGMLGEESGFFGIISGITVGSVTFMPPFVAFPLGKELLEGGGAYPQVAGFLVSVMSVGVVYLAAETRYFSLKSALFRNAVSVVAAFAAVYVVWVIYS